MALIEELEVVSLDVQHLQGALSLSQEAGWNQTVEDWTMMLESGQGIGLIDAGKGLVASALTLPYGSEFGWISMVLVTRSHRQQGLATKLLNMCIEKLEESGRVPVLDATPDGERVYRPLGFDPHFSLTRWQIDDARKVDLGDRSHDPAAIDSGGMEQVFALDRDYFGGDRSAIIAHLVERGRGFSYLTDDRTGFVLGRDGRVATQIGPLFASSPETAITLFRAALAEDLRPGICRCRRSSIFICCDPERVWFSGSATVPAHGQESQASVWPQGKSVCHGGTGIGIVTGKA